MTTPADTSAPQSGAPAQDSASGAELSIPKYRLDEKIAEVRRLQEEIALKERLYTEDRNRLIQQFQPRQMEADPTPEDSGLDPQTHQAVTKVALRIAERMVRQKESVFQEQLGMLANRAEKAEFLALKGADKAKYIPEIEKMQRDHFQRTGGSYMPAETAFDLMQSKEKDSMVAAQAAEIAALRAQIAGKTPNSGQAAPNPTPTSQTSSGGLPNASVTRQIPGGGGGTTAAAAKSSVESSLEELEARLEEQFKSGALL